MSKDIKAKLVPISEANGTVGDVVDINTGEKISNRDNTLIYVNENNVPVSKEYLEKNDYAYLNENGDLHAVKPLHEVEVSSKAGILNTLGKFINDEIFLNKDNIRVNNMRRLLSTESGRTIQKAFADGGRDSALLFGSPILLSNGIGTMLLNPLSTALGFGGSYLRGKTIDKLSTSINGSTWGQNVPNAWNKYAPTVDKMPEWVGDMTNPGAILGEAYGVTKGLSIDSKNLIPKFFKGDYITLKKGGRFKFRESSLVKNAKEKRDMRKKIIKSDRPTYNNKFIKKAQQGGTINYVTYTKLAPEVADYEIRDIPDLMENNILEVFNPYSFLKQPELTEDNVEQAIEEDKKITNWTPRDKKDYINTMEKVLYKALEDNGIDPNVWTKYLLAQTVVESNWGKSSISTKYNNYGGIKGKGSGLVSTREYDPNRGYYSIKDSFRSFDSVEDFADFFVKRLRDKFEAFSTTPEDYLKNIRKNGYFTAPLNDYSKTFNSIFNSISNILSSDRNDGHNKEYDLSKNIEELFKDAGIKVRVTSSYRPGSRTSSGKTSWHSIKDEYGNSRAYDIVPIDGNFNSLREAMINNPLVKYYFSKKGLGVLDETSPSMMAKTGATGKHFHIGPDRLALETWNKWIS